MTKKIRHVAVIGAGTMGHGIAQVCAAAGLRTGLWDVDPQQRERAIGRIQVTLEKGVKLGKTAPDVRDRALELLRPEDTLEGAAADADLIIEAAPERLELKRELFASLSAAAQPDAILASNTSGISIDEIAGGADRPERVVGLHFFNPVHLMRLLEVVRGARTAQEVVESSLEFARVIGKEPIVVSDTPGFASSRLGIVLGLEAMRMVEQGVAEPEAIDTAMVLGYNHPIGPLRLTDLVGLDVRLEIARYLYRTLGAEQYRPPEILQRMVQEGRLGKKTGQGFYSWEGS